MSTGDLVQVACNYRARISDLRAWGAEIECERREGGNNLYTLKAER